jgi:hypothetical protein
MTESREWTFGDHRARFEAPDVVVMLLSGPTRLEDAQRIVDIYREVGSRQPLFGISHVANTSFDKDVRAYFAQHARAEWFRGIVVIGAGFVQRAAVKAVTMALYFTGKWKADIEFADSEEAARALIERKRAASGTQAA